MVTPTPEIKIEEISSATVYPIDLRQSNINWTGRKIIIKTEHVGTVSFKSGEVQLKNNNLTGGSFVIDMSTITDQELEDKNKENLETHLKSSDFFDVVKYPEATLTMKSVSPGIITANEQNYNVTADLTIKGITNAVSFDVIAKQDSGLWIANADFSIDRTLWGIKYGSDKFFSDLGDKVIDDTISFKIYIEAPLSLTTKQIITSTETIGEPSTVDITTEVVPLENQNQ